MKKILSIIAFLFLQWSYSMAQVQITYEVDITEYLNSGAVLNPAGIRIGGNFSPLGVSLPDWTPSAGPCAMTDMGNNKWQIAITYPTTAIGQTQVYKFVNGNWGTNEISDSLIAGGCGLDDGQGNINRIFTIPSQNQTVRYCWDRCRLCFGPAQATVTTSTATNVAQTTATVAGNASGAGITARGVCYATTQNPTIANSIVAAGTGAGDFSSNLSSLTPNTQYYARAYATNGAGTAYGNEISFTTLPASVQTFSITYKVDITNYLAGGASVGANGIRIGGNFADRGTSLPNWTPSAAPCAMTDEGSNIWSITVSYPDTSAGKTQLYKFVNNDWGINEGSDSLVAGGCGEDDGGGNINRKLILPAQNQTLSFCWDRCSACFVPVLATVTTSTATNVAQTTATVAGNASGAGITARGVCYATTQNPTIANSIVAAGTGAGDFSANLSSLTPNTLYYARAYATNGAGTAYGNQISFTTLPASVQTFSITYKVDITNYLAAGAIVGANGIRIGGNFADRGTSLPNWTPSAAPCAMTDEGSNIWSITVSYPDTSAGKTQLYKFVNNDWGSNEGSDSLVAGGCGEDDGGGNINRKLILPAQNQTLSFCWDRCSACFVPVLATVTTSTATNVAQTTATVAGNASGAGITARGVCYATTQNPTIANSIVAAGTGAGDFSSNLSSLTPNTQYYARAYATNGAGTAYGNEVSFLTLPVSIQKDILLSDGKVFPNPFSDAILFEFRTEIQGHSFQLMNALGETVISGTITGPQMMVNTETLPNGVYFLKVASIGGVQRLIKNSQ